MSSMSYACGASETPLLGMTIGDAVRWAAERFPDREAVVVRHQNVRLTYRELAAEVDRYARALLAVGFRPGDRVGIWSPNRIEWVVTQYATASVGIILVNINPSYRVFELEFALRQSGCRGLILAPTFKTSDYVRMAREVAPELDRCSPGELTCERLPELKTVIHLGDEDIPGMFAWTSLPERGRAISDEHLRDLRGTLQFDDPINIQYTSGTTGMPKGATLSHHNILNNGFFVGEIMRFTDADRLVVPVPLYHCFGMVMSNLACLTHGATAIYPSEAFDPGAVLEAVAAERATALHGVPTMFIAELEHPDFATFDLSSLRTGIMAGAPCPVEVMKKVVARMHMREVEIAYGMTETSPVSTQTRADTAIERRISTVGTVHPHVEIKIIDPVTGRIVPRGTPGEFCTRGYSVMIGYWNDREATDRAIDAAGWMHTGDLAEMDADGFVRVTGRIKDMVSRGGEKIFPREVEEFLYTHPDIVDAQVIGVPDPRMGEEVMAWVKLREGADLTAEDIRSFCRDRIAHFKIPRYIKFVDAFPMTVTGKIQKYLMRQQSVAELGLES